MKLTKAHSGNFQMTRRPDQRSTTISGGSGQLDVKGGWFGEGGGVC